MKFLLVTSLTALILIGCNRGETTPSSTIGAYTYPYGTAYPTPTPYPGTGYTYYPQPTPAYTGAGSLTCQLGHLNTTYFVNSWVFSQITTNTGEPVVVTNWDAGEAWDQPPVYPKSLPLYVRYATSGTKLMQVWARGAQTGTPCNGGSAITDYVFVY